uniref:Ribosomal protein S6 kinase-like 1 n=1 Tax=Salarias fasciatus TaxID=181472 RepID=A0A672FZU7_SALFA
FLCHLGRLRLCLSPFTGNVTCERDYLVEAAKQIRMALDSEVNEDYEAAFSYYKNGVDLLLNGVQLDPNKDRREAVKRKTTQYLKRLSPFQPSRPHISLSYCETPALLFFFLNGNPSVSYTFHSCGEN